MIDQNLTATASVAKPRWQSTLLKVVAGLGLALAVPVIWYTLILVAILLQDGYLNSRIDPLAFGALIALLTTPALLVATAGRPRLRTMVFSAGLVILAAYTVWTLTFPVI